MSNPYPIGWVRNTLTSCWSGIRLTGCSTSILTRLSRKKYFSKKFPKFSKSNFFQLEAFGRDRMATEVAKLQNANRKLEKNCLSSDSSVRTVFKTVEITKYKLKEESDDFCQDLIRTERQVTTLSTFIVTLKFSMKSESGPLRSHNLSIPKSF